jgi:hypothetical protein
MKRTLLSLLFFVPMLLVSCTKDAPFENLQSTEALLKGTWNERSLSVIYYGSSGEKLYDESNATGTITFDGNSKVTAAYLGRPTVTGSYKIITEGSEEYLKVENEQSARVYKIASITGSALTLTLQTDNDIYFSDGKEYTAARSVLTSMMTKE